MDDGLRYQSLFLIERDLPVDPPSLPRRFLQGARPVATLSDSRTPAASGYVLWLLLPFLAPVAVAAAIVEVSQRRRVARGARDQIAAFLADLQQDPPAGSDLDHVLVRFDVMAPLEWDPSRSYHGLALLSVVDGQVRVHGRAAGRAREPIDELLASARTAIQRWPKAPRIEHWWWRLRDGESLVVDKEP